MKTRGRFVVTPVATSEELRAAFERKRLPQPHHPRVGFSDEPTECSCGSTWFECQQRRAKKD